MTARVLCWKVQEILPPAIQRFSLNIPRPASPRDGDLSLVPFFTEYSQNEPIASLEKVLNVANSKLSYFFPNVPC